MTANATVVTDAERAVEAARDRALDWMQESRTKKDAEPDVDSVIQYTSLATLASMLPYTEPKGVPPRLPQGPEQIWASAAPHMNDVREFSYGQEAVLKALLDYRANGAAEAEAKALMVSIAEDAKGEDLYCACFSAKFDDLGQWRGYGDDGRGCCVVFNLDELQKAHAWLSGWVLYGKVSQRNAARRLAREFVGLIAPHTKASTGRELPDGARRDLARLVPSTFVFFKDPAFKEEQEFRLVYAPVADAVNLPVHFQERRGRVVPHVRLPFEGGAPLREIWIGPRNDFVRTRPAIDHLKRERELHGVTVRESKIPYLP